MMEKKGLREKMSQKIGLSLPGLKKRSTILLLPPYLTQITPSEVGTERGQRALQFLNFRRIQYSFQHWMERWSQKLVGKLLWDMCKFHTNELGLRHVMKSEGMETSGLKMGLLNLPGLNIKSTILLLTQQVPHTNYFS